MRTIAIATVAALAFLQAASAFLAPVPAQTRAPISARRNAGATKMMLSPLDITQSLVAYSKDFDVYTKNQGDYAWGSVAAPDWVLPVASIAILSLGVLIPLFLKPGVDAFNTGGAKGAERKAAAVGKAVPAAKPGAAKPAAKAGPAKAAGGSKVVAKKGAAAPAAPAPKKKGWF